MTSTLVLAPPDFTKPFTIVYNAPIVVLERSYLRTSTPLSFITNHWLRNIMFAQCMHDKEMLVVVFAVQKRQPYLLDHRFKILMDH